MNTLEISTITILHTLSTLSRRDLALLGFIARGNISSQIAQLIGVETVFVDDQTQVLLRKFNLTSIEDLSSMLSEINFLNMLKEKRLV